VRNELQNAADAAALAATQQLGHFYEGKRTPIDISSIRDTIISEAKNTAQGNKAAGVSIGTVLDADITIGKWNAAAKSVTPTPGYDDAVRVTVRRDSSANGKIQTLLAGIIGVTSQDVMAMGTASLTGQSTSFENGLPIPLGISKNFFPACNTPITFYPTNDSCAGWHNYFGDDLPLKQCNDNPSAECLKDIVSGLTDGTFHSPASKVGDIFHFTGGTTDPVIVLFQALWEKMRFLDGDGNDLVWTATVVVYDADCLNPNGDYKVLGYATAEITEVIATGGNKQVNGVVRCGQTDPGRGSGGEYGTMGSIPGLVQ